MPDTVVEGVVAAAVPGGRVVRVLEGDDPRRRTIVRVRGPHGDVIVKIEPPGSEGRGAVEQGHLETLRGAGIVNVPAARGHGETEGRAWAVESVVGGSPLASAGRWWRWRHGRAVLDSLATWFDDLAAATSHPAPASMAGVPAVLVHGDLSSGINVLVKGRRFAVVDWETAEPDGSPLVDVLPTLAFALGRLAGHRTVEARASYAIALCRGEVADSAWLFERVRRHVTRVGVPPAQLGALATQAWTHQASLRIRHAALVRAAGGEPPDWVSPAELVLERWTTDSALGTDWTAFQG